MCLRRGESIAWHSKREVHYWWINNVNISNKLPLKYEAIDGLINRED